MRDFNRLAVLVLSALALVASCSDDDPVQPPGESSEYHPLTTREAVLYNLEVAWRNRATDRIDDILDDNFRFYLHPGDVGPSIPAQWGRADEIGTTGALFMSNTTPIANAPVCRSVRLDLNLDDVEWVQVPDTTSGERHTTIVNYEFAFKMEPDFTFLSEPGARAQLTVREVAVGGRKEWRLVEWRDIGSNLLAGGSQNASTSESTWGAVKALYLQYLSLTTRDAVLTSLEAAWNERSTNIMSQLLDDHFTFYFSQGDVGGEIPPQWGRAEELQTSHDLFVSNHQPITTGPACTSLHVDLVTSDLEWIEIIPEYYPSETWYATTVFYSAWFEMENEVTFIITPGAKAQFVVRNVGSDTAPDYQLVEWRELGNALLLGSGQAGSEATWGGIKALYQ